MRNESSVEFSLVVTGTGYPRPAPNVAGPSALVRVGGFNILVDCGRSTVMRLADQGLWPHDIDLILITHFHSDHVSALPDLLMSRWLLSESPRALRVVGPRGTLDLVERSLAMLEHDFTRRGQHRGHDRSPRPDVLEFERKSDISEVMRLGGVSVASAAVQHGYVEEAVGYRISVGDRSLAISGDTTECEGVCELARDANVLLHEVIDPERLRASAGERAMYICDYHATPQQVGRMAWRSGVGQVVLTHIIPALVSDADAQALVDGVASEYSGPVHVARDGFTIAV